MADDTAAAVERLKEILGEIQDAALEARYNTQDRLDAEFVEVLDGLVERLTREQNTEREWRERLQLTELNEHKRRLAAEAEVERLRAQPVVAPFLASRLLEALEDLATNEDDPVEAARLNYEAAKLAAQINDEFRDAGTERS